jgi:hypothetical protein
VLFGFGFCSPRGLDTWRERIISPAPHPVLGKRKKNV